MKSIDLTYAEAQRLREVLRLIMDDVMRHGQPSGGTFTRDGGLTEIVLVAKPIRRAESSR